MHNSAAYLQFAHMWVGAFMLVGFLVAGVYAAGMLRGRVDAHHRMGFAVPFTFASIAAVVQPFIGHVLGAWLAERQPSKLAAFELATTTEHRAPLRIGGVLVDGKVVGSIEIPRLGSIVSRNSLDAPVPGLDSVPADQRPPVNITHLAFQTMIGIGTLLALVAVGYWIARRRGYEPTRYRRFLQLVVLAGPLAVLALEAGWVATEVGRQPWTVWQVLRTNDAAGDNPGLWWVFSAVALLYVAMTVGAVTVVRSMTRRWRAGEHDLPSPYGPESAIATGDRS
jgi:cytochrome d ubiquinol oxidase subunit I